VDVRRVDVAGTTLHVRTWGDAEGIPFVFWHSLSFGGNGSFLDVATPALVEAGLAPIAPDAAGYGGSPPLVDCNAYGIDRLVDLVWALVDTHAVFADLGGEAGAIAADWLRGIGLAGLPDL
jgi:hypothetical protein